MSITLSKTFAQNLRIKNKYRVKRLSISGLLLVQMFQEGIHDGYKIVENHLPDDAIVIRSGFDNSRNILELFIWSKTFDPVPEGELTPDYPNIIVKTLKKEYDRGQQRNYIGDNLAG